MSAIPEITTPWLDLDAAGNIAIGCGLVGIGVGVLLKDPSARDFCGRVLDHPRVREALSAVAAAGWDTLRPRGTPPV
jgi:hypothetical protein